MTTRAEHFADQKPRKGDPVTYCGKFAGTVSSVQGNLCHVSAPTLRAVFVWRFGPEMIGGPRLNKRHDWPTKRDMRWDEGRCPFGDETCPCQDGDPCHYVDLPGSPAMEPPP